MCIALAANAMLFVTLKQLRKVGNLTNDRADINIRFKAMPHIPAVIFHIWCTHSQLQTLLKIFVYILRDLSNLLLRRVSTIFSATESTIRYPENKRFHPVSINYIYVLAFAARGRGARGHFINMPLRT